MFKARLRLSSGGSARSGPRAVVALAVAVVLLLLGATGASAAGMEEKSSFGCSEVTEGFCENTYVAADEASGDVFVVDAAHQAVDRFDKEGKLLSEIKGAESFEFSGSSFAEDIAVDDSGGSLQGRLYVVSEKGGIWGFEPDPSQSSGYREVWHQPPTAAEPCGIAVDSSGAPWVGEFKAEAAAELNAADGTETGTSIAVTGHHPCQIAFDSAGNLYAHEYKQAIFKYPGGSELEESFGSFDVATDTSTGDVYASKGVVEILVWDSSGVLTANSGFATGTQPKAVAVDAAHSRIYISGAAGNPVRVFWEGAQSPKPFVRTGEGVSGVAAPASGVSGSAATVHGVVDPAGSLVTQCVVEYGTTTALGSSSACSSEPGSGSGEVAVDAALSGLAAETTYYYRVSATNANGTVKGSVGSFSTATPKLVVFVSGHGSVSASSGAVSGCEEAAGVCEGEYAGGTTVTLTAAAKPGYAFVGWLGCRHATATTCTVTISGETEVTAVFLKEGVVGPEGKAGAEGKTGLTGPIGPQGPAGANGKDGAAGPQGPAGATGQQGPAGPTGKIVCKVKQKGKKITVTCALKAKGARASAVHWRLVRHGHTVGHGASRGVLRLGNLRAGRYSLLVQGRDGSTAIVIG